VVGKGCEDDYELSDYIKSNKRMSMVLSASLRMSAQFGQLVLQPKFSHYMSGEALTAPGD
jgi:hypothetical protein